MGRAPLGKWEAPQLGWYKVNWDIALGVHNNKIGLGVVIQDHMGRLVAARCVTRQGRLEPAVVEAMAAFVATQTTQELGIQKAWFEGDVKSISEVVNSLVADLSRIGHLVDDLRLELNKIPHWKMTYVCRENNRAAHVLARKATSKEMDGLWLQNFPEWLTKIIVSKHNALFHD